MFVCSLKACFMGLQQLTVLEVWSTFNNQLQRVTDTHAEHCLFVLFLSF